jgi:hypothetical protein
MWTLATGGPTGRPVEVRSLSVTLTPSVAGDRARPPSYPDGMAMVTVLTTAPINLRKVDRRLARAGYTVTAMAGGVLVSRHDARDAVDIAVSNVADLPGSAIDSARRLLGLSPRSAISCSFEGPAGRSEAWSTVIGIARAVAAEVPLAVLDDHLGTTYLVHPGRGLIGPAEYETVRRGMPASTGEMLRKMFGAGR